MASNFTTIQNFLDSALTTTLSAYKSAASYISPTKPLTSFFNNTLDKTKSIGGITFNLINKTAPYIYKKESWEKATSFLDFRVMSVASYWSQAAYFGTSLTFGIAACQTKKMQAKVLYAGTAILAASLGVYEMLTLKKNFTCVDSIKCPQDETKTPDYLNAYGTVKPNPPYGCIDSAFEAFSNCTKDN